MGVTLVVTPSIGDMKPEDLIYLQPGRNSSRAREIPIHPKDFCPKIYPSTRNAGTRDGVETFSLVDYSLSCILLRFILSVLYNFLLICFELILACVHQPLVLDKILDCLSPFPLSSYNIRFLDFYFYMTSSVFISECATILIWFFTLP